MVKKKYLGNYPLESLIVCTSLALFVLGLLTLLLLNTKKISNLLKDQVKLFIYLEKNLNPESKNEIYNFLKNQPFTLQKSINSENFFDIKYISAEEAAQKYIKNTNENFWEVLDTNPLRDTFIIGIKHSFQSKEILKAIKGKIERFNNVFEVCYIEDLTYLINNNLQKIKNILVLLSVILFFCVIILIKNTVKLALYSQRFLIRSMQLVGAVPSFIKSPFIRRAIISGIFSGIISSIMILTLLSFINYKSISIAQLQNPKEIMLVLFSLIIFGILIDTFSTYFSINKYLNMSLDDLY